jgi:hypothetical protein
MHIAGSTCILFHYYNKIKWFHFSSPGYFLFDINLAMILIIFYLLAKLFKTILEIKKVNDNYY